MSAILDLDPESSPAVSRAVGNAPVLAARNLAKTYRIYARPIDRLQQALFGSNASRYFTEFHALDGVSFEVRQGEAVAFIGRNGAGKSTLLQIISGVILASAGEVDVRGRIAPLLELGTSFNPEFTGLENIELAGSILGLTEREIADRREAVVAFADIGAYIAQPVRTYSSGMYARLAFAVAAHVDADILILDEILSVGDIRFTQKCVGFIKEFRERGTLLFVSHDISSVLAICDRAIWLDRGRVVEDDRPARVIPHYQTYMSSSDQTLDAFVYRDRIRTEESRQKAAVMEELTGDSVGHIVDSRPGSPAFVSKPASAVRFSGFDWSATSHGERRGAILEAYWTDENGGRIATLAGGDVVSLVVVLEAAHDLMSPIVGFAVRDRLGQTVFAWDTSREPGLLAKSLKAGARAAAHFTFRFPYLLGGTYAMILALADGTPQQNSQEHWLFDAMTFDVTWSTVTQGLIGVPIKVTFEAAP